MPSAVRPRILWIPQPGLSINSAAPNFQETGRARKPLAWGTCGLAEILFSTGKGLLLCTESWQSNSSADGECSWGVGEAHRHEYGG